MSCAEFIREILQNEWVAVVYLSAADRTPEYSRGKLTIPRPNDEIADVLCEFGIKVLSLPPGYGVNDVDIRVFEAATLISTLVTTKLQAYSHKLINFPISYASNHRSEIGDLVMYPMTYCSIFTGIKNIFVESISNHVPDYDLNYVSMAIDNEYASIDYAKKFKTKYLNILVVGLTQDFCDRWHELLDGTILEHITIRSPNIEFELPPIPSNVNTRLRGYLLNMANKYIRHDSLEEVCALNSSARRYRTKSANKLG